MTQPTVILCAKQPKVGAAKTRLAAEIGALAAARVYDALLAASIQRFSDLPFPGKLVVAITPDEGISVMRQTWSTKVDVVGQGAGNLGSRLTRVSENWFRENVGPLFFVGTDSPDLPDTILAGARRACRSGAFAICQARDGGYAMLGMPHAAPALFVNIDWGGPTVCEQTVRAAHDADLVMRHVGIWDDVDYLADLVALIARIQMTQKPYLQKLRDELNSILESARIGRQEQST